MAATYNREFAVRAANLFDHTADEWDEIARRIAEETIPELEEGLEQFRMATFLTDDQRMQFAAWEDEILDLRAAARACRANAARIRAGQF